MRALAALLLGAALACRGSRTQEREEAMSSAGAATVARRTSVTLSDDRAGADPDGRRGFLASARCALSWDGRWLACDLPPLEGGGRRVAVAELEGASVEARTVSGELPEGGAPVMVDGDRAWSADGAVLPVDLDPALGPREYVRSTWITPVGAASPLLRYSTIRDAGRWSLDAYDGARPRWRVGAGILPGEPAGVAITADGNLILLAVVTRSPETFELVALDAVTAKPRWRARLDARPIGPILGSSESVAVLVRDRPRCESCLKLTLVAVDRGRVLHDAPLPSSTLAESAGSAGLSGDTAWFYRYRPPRTTSELAPLGRTPVEPDCGYEVYALSNPQAPARTLDQADGEWRTVAAGCQVRGLFPLAGGRVAAVRITGASSLEVVDFDRAP
jgi:hypothetical protein